MLIQSFIQACLNMIMEGLSQGLAIVNNAKRVNDDSNMDLKWLISILFNLYKVLANTIEQIRRFYQFLSAGET